MPQEAICQHCKVTMAIKASDKNKMVNCLHCGFRFLLSSDKLILKPDLFTKIKMVPEDVSNIKYPIAYIRHGKDNYQQGILYKLMTNRVKFTTKTKLLPMTKISFLILDKKFIVSIRNCKSKIVTDVHGDEESLFDIAADFVTITQGTKKRLIRANPHYLIK